MPGWMVRRTCEIRTTRRERRVREWTGREFCKRRRTRGEKRGRLLKGMKEGRMWKEGSGWTVGKERMRRTDQEKLM